MRTTRCRHRMMPCPCSRIRILHPLNLEPSTLNPMAEEIYSPGLEGVIAGETAISTVSGGLSYRGYSIEDLARHGTFEEVAYLLLYGELPTAEQLDEFRKRLKAASQVPRPIIDALATDSADRAADGCAALGAQHAGPLGPGCQRQQPRGQRAEGRAAARAVARRDGGPASAQAGQGAGAGRRAAGRSRRTACTCCFAPIRRPATSRRWTCR